MALEDKFSPLERILDQLIEENVKKYKDIMLSVLGSKQPCTVKPPEQHHEVVKNRVLADFNQFRSSLLLGFPGGSNIFNTAMEKLQLKLDFEMPTLVRQHEVMEEKVMSQIKQCTLHAEKHYNDLMLEFIPGEASSAEIQGKHDEMRKKALKQFEENIKIEKLEMHEEWKMRLEQKLEAKVQEMLSKCRVEPKIKPAAEINFISPEELDQWISTLNLKTRHFNSCGKVIGPNASSENDFPNLPIDTSVNENTANSSHSNDFQNSSQTNLKKNGESHYYISPAELDEWMSTLNFQTGYCSNSNTMVRSNCSSEKDFGNSRVNLRERSTSFCESTDSRNSSLQNSITNSIWNSQNTVVETDEHPASINSMEVKTTFLSTHEIPCDIGIYLDKRIVSVGWISPESGGFQNILTTTAEIAFQKNCVLIGGEAAQFSNQRNHIFIADVIGDKTRHDICLRTSQQNLSSEVVLHKFFYKLSTDVLSSTGCQYVRNVVISLPYATTCNERRRIKATLQGIYENVRVLSSLITTAAFYAAHELYYFKDIQNPKCIFVAQSLRSEFSMAAVEIGPGGIVTKNVVSSRNFKEGASYDFLDSHARIFDGVELTVEKAQRIWKMYSQAGKQLIDQSLHGRNNETLIVINDPESQFNGFYKNIFPQWFHTHFNIQNGPLQGACLLADNRSIRPPQICDRSRTFFSLSFCAGLQQPSGDCKLQEIVDLNKQPFHARLIPLPSAMIAPHASFLLRETYNLALISVKVDHHYFTHERVSLFDIEIDCDDDGILSLKAQPVEIGVEL